MPGPALPAWALAVLGAAAVGLTVLVTYFVTSSQAKARAAKFKEKVLRIVEALKKRLDMLHEALHEARKAQAEAESRAAEAEEAARHATEQTADADREAARAREDAARAAEAALELERQLAEARAELEKWRRESEVADKLGGVAGAALSVHVLQEIREINATSLLLGGRMPRPGRAMAELEERLAEVERGNDRLEGRLVELTSGLRQIPEPVDGE